MKIWIVYGSEPHDGTMYAAKYFLSQEKAAEYLEHLTKYWNYTYTDCEEIQVED